MNNGQEMISKEVCLECGSERLAEKIQTQEFPYGTTEHRVTLSAQIPVFTCLDCGYEFFDERGEAARHEAICRHLGVLTPDEVRKVRESSGMSRAQLCELAGFGPASLQRWESGAVIPNASSDRLIYLLQFDENRHRLQAKRNIGSESQISSAESDASTCEARNSPLRRTKATYHLHFPTLEKQGELPECSRMARFIQKQQCMFASTV